MTLADWGGMTPPFLARLTQARRTQRPTPAVKWRDAHVSAVWRDRVGQKVAVVARKAMRLSSFALLVAATAINARPAACVQATLHCQGDTGVASSTARDVGAAFMILSVACHLLLRDHCVESAQSRPDGPPTIPPTVSANWPLALGILSSSLIQSHALHRDGHALARWARRTLHALVSSVGVATLATSMRRCPCSVEA